MSARNPPSLLAEEDDVRITSQLKVDRRRKVNQYVRKERIGKGHHGEVFLCTEGGFEGREVALKVVKRNSPRDRIKLLRRNHQQNARDREVPALSSTEHSIRREIAVMKKCRHGNIVQLFEVIDDPQQDKIYLAMEYLSGGQVQWKDAEDRPMLSVDETRHILRDVILGLEYLHHQGIIHRDIKPANLLWTHDRTIVKIIDFGVSHFSPEKKPPIPLEKQEDPYNDSLFHESDLLKRFGTPSFLAPEIVWFSVNTFKQSPATSCETLASRSNSMAIKDDCGALPSQRPPVTKAIDVWSLAVTFYCLLFGHTPFNVPESANENSYHNEFVLYDQICTQDWGVDETMGCDRISSGGRHPTDNTSEGSMVVLLLDQMLQKDPKARLTVYELKRNPWVLHGILDPSEWLTDTSPSPPRESTSYLSRWKQASRKLLDLLPRPRRIPPL